MAVRENRLRRAILHNLYQRFREVPLAPVELGELAADLKAQRTELRWNAAYLSLAGLLTMHSVHSGTGQGLSLTAAGIDLVEDARGLRTKFPVRKPRKPRPE